VLHGSLEKHYATLVELSQAGAGIFVTINKTTLGGARDANNITEVRAQFVDCDGVLEDEIKAGIALLKLHPHIVTRSSPGKYHLYWCVIDAPLDGFRETQKQLILLFGSDPQVHDLPRVMRIPGFPHQKDGSKGEIVQLLETNDADDYSEVQFQTALANALRQSEREKIDSVIKNLGSPPLDWTQGYPEGERNNECARRAGSCFARGMTQEEALEKCQQWNRECNSPPLSDDEVAATVASIASPVKYFQGVERDG
jgi:Primase C terminal 1 (PriCT-1)/RepB DNA-primase from phage plasmid